MGTYFTSTLFPPALAAGQRGDTGAGRMLAGGALDRLERRANRDELQLLRRAGQEMASTLSR
jgi:hypothetical protein